LLPSGCTLSGNAGTQQIVCAGTVCQTFSAAAGLNPSRCSLSPSATCRSFCFDNFAGGQNTLSVAEHFTFASNGLFSFNLDQQYVCFQNGNIAARPNVNASYCADTSSTLCASPLALFVASVAVPFGSTGFVSTGTPMSSSGNASSLSTAPQNVQIWLSGDFPSVTTGTPTSCWVVQQNLLAGQTSPRIEVIETPYAVMPTW
jgi:hypothetical protein